MEKFRPGVPIDQKGFFSLFCTENCHFSVTLVGVTP